MENNKDGVLERLGPKPKFKVQRLHKKPIKGLKRHKAIAWQSWSGAVCRVITVMRSGSCGWPLRFSMRDSGGAGKLSGVSNLL